MFKKLSERRIHLVVLAFSTGLFLGINFSFAAKAGEPAHKYLEYFHRVYQMISTEYVDEPDNKKLFYGAIKGMIQSLGDPFTRFLDKKATSELQEMTTGKFVGIGVEIAVKDGEIVVVSPIDNSPAMKAGVESGDIITKVNDESIKDKNLNEIIKKIKGLPGTKVTISVRREGFTEDLSYEIERAPIKIESTEYALINNYNTGYLRIKTFGSDTSSDVKKALEFFKGKKADRLIIDLRFNPGGLLTAAVDISDFFLDKDTVIVSTKGRGENARENIFKASKPAYYPGEVIILVNRGSASASEILSGALKDNKRAILVGEKTFGKGSVQKTYSLDNELGIALTIAKYYTPSGAMIHGKGIMPDREVKYADVSESDTEELKKISREKLLNKFVTIKTKYNESVKNEFHKFLQSNNIKISDKTADFILKREINKYHKNIPYDLEFDSQLITALEMFKKK
ncbi:MAG TPA: S41 family peptidase [Spirochaetota bacterium]|nr:S41 family peptidase [Spirochaetota bacterium]HPJ35964.1 S41 family peptidase [Spirochaetota bacterium]